MNTQVKISSQEGGIFTANNNRISFSIPGNSGVYDLSESYINLICTVPITAEEERTSNNAGATPLNNIGIIAGNSVAQGQGVYAVQCSMNDDGGNNRAFNYENAVLVKNINMSCNNFGNIEHIKRNDIYSASVNAFSKNMGDRKADSYANVFKVANNPTSFDSLFGDYNKESTVPSRNLQRQAVRIPLKDMLQFCNVKQYDTGRFGKTDIEMELNLDRVRVTNLMGQNTNFQISLGNDAEGTNLGNMDYFRCINMTATIGANQSELQLSSDGTTTHRAVARLEDIPFYVGQKINIGALYTQGGGAVRNGDGNRLVRTRRIIEIRYNRGQANIGIPGALNNTNSVSLILNAPLFDGTALAGNETYTAIQIRGAECTFGAFQCDFAELMVKQLDPSNIVEDSGSITYKSYDTEEFSTLAVSNLRRIFECPPNCFNLFIANSGLSAAVGAAGVNGFVSRLDQLDNYRLRIDNEDCSNKPIRLRDTNGQNVNSTTQDPLHLQKLIVSFKNSDKSLRGLQERYQNASNRSGLFRNRYQTDAVLIGQVLPITSSPKQVQVEMNCNAGQQGLTALTLFKEVVKTIG